jgi:transketolase
MTQDAGGSLRGYLDAAEEIRARESDVVVINAPPGSNVIPRAAGLALEGMKVFVSYGADAVFAGRCYEYIRSAALIPNLKIALSSVHDGEYVNHGGAVRQMNEDFALMRALPGMSALAPSDRRSAYVLTLKAASSPGLAYFRLSSEETKPVYAPDDSDFSLGGARLLSEGDGVTICAVGVMTREALAARDTLAAQGIGAEVIDCYSVKPFPEEILLASARRTGCCVVAEKHAGIGGLFGAVTECLSRHYPVPARGVSIDDRFGQSGTGPELREYYGLTRREIVHNALQVWAIRRR